MLLSRNVLHFYTPNRVDVTIFVPQPLDPSRTFHVCEKTHDLRIVTARARMTATAPFGAKVEALASASISLVRFSDLTFTITTTLEGGDGATGSSPGDRIKYDLSITNDGTVTITDLDVTDSLLSVADDRQEDVTVGHVQHPGVWKGGGGHVCACTRTCPECAPCLVVDNRKWRKICTKQQCLGQILPDVILTYHIRIPSDVWTDKTIR